MFPLKHPRTRGLIALLGLVGLVAGPSGLSGQETQEAGTASTVSGSVKDAEDGAFLLLLSSSAALGQVTGPQDLAGWGRALDLDPRISREILRFRGGTALDEAQAQAFARAVRSRVIASAAERIPLLQTGQCSPFVDVTMGEADFPVPEEITGGAKKAWEEFEGSLIRTEMVACLETDMADADSVLQIYVSPEFRMVAESRIIKMWEDPEGSCMETKGVLSLVEPTRVCNRIRDFRAEGIAAQHSQVVFNEGRKPYEDVYFKESLKTFVRIPGGMALHYINYARAGNLGRLERWAGPGQIRGSQEGNVAELQKRLRLRSSGPPASPTGPGRPPETPGSPRRTR